MARGGEEEREARVADGRGGLRSDVGDEVPRAEHGEGRAEQLEALNIRGRQGREQAQQAERQLLLTARAELATIDGGGGGAGGARPCAAASAALTALLLARLAATQTRTARP